VSRPEPRYTLNISFGSDPERLEGLVGALLLEIERLKTEGPSELDAQRVREIQRRERETSLRQNGYWISQLAGYAREGFDFADILRYESLIEGLTADLIRDAALTLIRTDNFVRVSLLPAGG
jgi:zinc protease